MPPASTDPTQLSQILLNLILNAVQAMEAVSGPRKLAIATRRAEDGFVEAAVTDSGPGIAESARDRLFDQFFTTKPLGQGTGLGLDIARRIVRNHDGVLEFDTRPGCTEFRVILPAVSS